MEYTKKLGFSVFNTVAIAVGLLISCQSSMAVSVDRTTPAPQMRNISDPPNAGMNGAISICSNSSPVSLFAALDGDPDMTGSWSGPSDTNGMFDPGTMIEGVYTYTVSGDGQYPDAIALVSVYVQQAPNAGDGGIIEVCNSGGPISLFWYLTGNPNSYGTWHGPNGLFVSGTFSPNSDQHGTYTYIVQGSGPCSNAAAELLVVEIDLESEDIIGPAWVHQGDTALFEAIPFLPYAEQYSWTLPGGWSFATSETNGRSVYLIKGNAGLNNEMICTQPTGLGCFGPIACTQVNSDVGIPNNPTPFDPIVFPNPSSGSIQVKWANATPPVLLELVNSTGQQIWSMHTRSSFENIELEDLASGLYMLRWSTPNSFGTKQIVIER